jgi:valyl-tRNA synthetase
VADAAVEPGFGSGVLKVTPGHAAADYEIGQRHGLPVVNGLRPDGRLGAPGLPAYDGLGVDEARALVLRDLAAGGYLVRQEPYAHQVGHCDRCAHVVETLVSEQWFLKMDALARRALAASQEGPSGGRGVEPARRAGRVRWYPERYERGYLEWLRGLRDWCVSRQLWLGHRIPVYTCPAGHRSAAVDPPEACPVCGAAPLAQDPDVLDTWFSAALWPFATLGWPDDTADLRAFYPTALNGTDRQIINLWVSRMLMCGLELTGEVPFGDVTIHATILSHGGRRMSKSRPETVVDPREVLRRYGADALRAWCAQVAMSTQDVRFDERRIVGYRRLANKLWNAARLVLGALNEPGDAATGAAAPGLPEPTEPAEEGALWLADRWILSRLQETVRTVTRGIEGFAFHLAVESAQHFTWHEYCDWYLEAAKPRLRRGDPAALGVALHVLDTLCRLLHPIMPFLTEELWRRLPAGAGGRRDFLVRSAWPVPDPRRSDAEVEVAFARLMQAVEAARQARSRLANPQYRARTAPEALRGDEALAATLPEAMARLQGRA